VRTGVRLACDAGSVRIGLARSDPAGILAVPLDAVAAGPESWAAIGSAVEEWSAIEVIVGLPLTLSGEEGLAAETARSWAVALSERIPVPVRLVDERLSTVQAQRGLHESGRSTRASRSRIDSASAVIVLQSALDSERVSGQPAGTRVDEDGGQAG
jgi:putative Holliday junction resolvase